MFLQDKYNNITACREVNITKDTIENQQTIKTASIFSYIHHMGRGRTGRGDRGTGFRRVRFSEEGYWTGGVVKSDLTNRIVK